VPAASPRDRCGGEAKAWIYDEGYSAEMLAEEFPTLSLALIHKTIGFYLENRADIDTYIAQCATRSSATHRPRRAAPVSRSSASAWPRHTLAS
jgi:hypothetical protein